MHRIIPFIISLSFFMEAVDSTVINTAIPAISQSLNVAAVDLKIALISYLLSMAIFIPISGWLADRYGAKKVFISALILFTASSFVCGFAESLLGLTLARFIQGLGGALTMPVGRLILVRTFGQKNLVLIMSQVVMVGALGIMLGPVIGGYITHYFSWHWIFWVNVPIGLFAILMTWYKLPADPTLLLLPPRLDKWGFIYFGLSLAGITLGLSTLSESNIDINIGIGILFFSILFLFLYLMHSKKQPHPIVRLELLNLRTFRISFLGNLISRLGFGGVPFLMPLMLQIGLGFPAQISGLLLAPMAIGVLFSKLYVLRLLRRLGYKKCLIINTLCVGLGICAFAFINFTTPYYLIAAMTGLYGFMISVQYSAMNSLAYADLKPEFFSAATSIMGTLQQLAQSFGVAICALFLRFFSKTPLTLTDFHLTFLVVGLVTLTATLVFLPLTSKDGQQMVAN